MNILVALGLTILAIGVSKGFFEYRPPGWSVLFFYLACYFVLQRRERKLVPAHFADEPDPDYSGWPTSGPIGRFGQKGLIATWYASQLLCALNPFQFVQFVRQIAGNTRAQAREDRTLDPRVHRNRVPYTLPFRGEWFVYNGGFTPKTSHSWDVLAQRYALDFVIADEQMRRHRPRGIKAGDYFCFGHDIVAAADGEVVAVQDGIGQAPFLGFGICDFTARSFIGNHVLIRHAEGEYALYAHLIAGSLNVAPGDRVVRGRTIGRCGHTGHSTEPHLHFHLQDSADVYGGVGIPVWFTGLSIDGKPVDGAHLTAGNRVRPLPAD